MNSFYDLVSAFTYPDDDLIPHHSSLRRFQYDLKEYKRAHRKEHPFAEQMNQVIKKLYLLELRAAGRYPLY
jgi:hypothetical protein